MKSIVFVVAILIGGTAFAADGPKLPAKDKVAGYLQDISVTINAGDAEGSGVIVTRVIDGVSTNFVVTAAHVVDGLRSEETVIDPKTGTKREIVKFADAAIVKELVENGRRVGELKMDASVIRFNAKEDIAALRVRKSGFVNVSTVFYLGEEIPAIGTPLFHVGSLLGQMGSNSMTSGIISQIGRVLEDKLEYDQTTCTAFPGSSGGGVYLQDGAYIGCLVRGAGEGFNLTVPSRRILKWADKAGVKWIFDPTVKAPTADELEKLPVEDTGVSFPGSSKVEEEMEKNFPHLIRIIHRIIAECA